MTTLTAEDLAQVQLIIREELTRILHPSAQRLAPAPPPANDHSTQPDQPPPHAA